MYIKIQTGSRSDTYECDSFAVWPSEHKTNEIELELMRAQRPTLHIVVDKGIDDAVNIFAMNDLGRTIDSIFRKDKGTL